ncbi:MAG TPA: hypothetical protein VE467_15510 [Chryseolinea sp.]|nr:hypothetical protein [Chryseolinea sp.]
MKNESNNCVALSVRWNRCGKHLAQVWQQTYLVEGLEPDRVTLADEVKFNKSLSS